MSRPSSIVKTLDSVVDDTIFDGCEKLRRGAFFAACMDVDESIRVMARPLLLSKFDCVRGLLGIGQSNVIYQRAIRVLNSTSA